MTFISYAQNYEDVILRRAFSDVEKGFYIDVGANDPVIDSVTKAFYDVGWRGINIEPVSEWYEKLLIDRPNDINLQIAAGDQDEELDFYEVIGTGLSTADASIAERHVKDHDYQVKSYKIQATTLTIICEEHAHPDIHFLKIDVEGAEKSVLEGLDLSKFRPWVILIESTLPNSTTDDHEEWEYIILAADYDFVYFDGLNRFYVAKEHQEIKSNLAIPPNFFDNFVLSGTASSSFHYQIAQIQTSLAVANENQQRSEAKQQESENRLAHLAAEAQILQEEATLRDNILRQRKKTISSLEMQLQDVYNSGSWRITWPLRKLLRNSPNLEAKLKRLARIPGSDKTSLTEAPKSLNLELSKLTPSARRIYKQLQVAIEEHQKVSR